MTGGSLGLRTASYGSLQQQLQNGAFLPIHATPLIVRKNSKTLLSSYREKERFLSRICKFASRRRVGMLLVVVVSVLVFMSVLSTMCKDDDATTDSESQHMSSIPVQNIIPERILINGEPSLNKIDKNRDKENYSVSPNNVSISGENKLPLPVLRTKFPVEHPCDKFVLPSPPPRDRKRTGPRPCPVCYLPVDQAIARMPVAPSESPVLRNLTYVYEESPVRTEPFGGSDFGGYPSLMRRNDSFDIKESMNVHCGFVNGSKPGRQTGFDLQDADLIEMEQCYGVVVASAIFGNYDIIQQPKNISEAAKKNVCFYMFVDEETEASIRNTTTLGDGMKVGLWRLILVRNLPYADARRNGKVPKLLLHRIFPNSRFSLWVDGKLELVVDPYQILERFLWRKNATFAISRHYKRFDVIEEAEANKAAGKYENASIDFQIDFYKGEGLTPYTEAKLPITSDVPEGCVIIREHIPLTNLFTCLWFNEVDRFTSRDQLSFSSVRDKIMSKVNWGVDMFLDCERRNFVVQTYHRDVLEHMPPPIVAVKRPSVSTNEPRGKSSHVTITDRFVKSPTKRNPPKRGRERRSGSRRHRKVSVGSRDNNSI
ncbi:hypothetical protein MKW98_024661 [Papaver atlanticum]|uniref:TOD1/MUCI70 glycosyltransferase-like domain-containing protein n=1 Tax=Papaver atlanticum TaxID=357466 RepID=A0AAD4X6Q8_9MAGN|nr:hypothetical protein MKW98_024661 [Papaver atlanticum]